MVSTYIEYSIIARDMKESISRVSDQKVVARDTQYYKENIGKVTSIDEFLGDYRLYSYAMKAHGLEEMTYAKAFMRKVLESDLSDDSSYANQLTDERYRNFAMAFSFDQSTTVAQTSTQEDAVIGLYNTNIDNIDAGIRTEVAYFDAMTTGNKLKTVDQFLQNDRLRAYTFPLFDLNPDNYDYDQVRKALTSDVADTSSYVNTNLQSATDAMSGRGAAIQATIAKYNERTNAVTQIKTLMVQKAQPGADQAAIQTKIDEYKAIYDARDAELPPYSTTSTNLALLNTEYAKLDTTVTLAKNLKGLATTFSFNADGTVPTSIPLISDANKESLRQLTFATAPRLTGTGALINKAYYEAHIGDFSTVSDLLGDARMRSYIINAYGLSKGIAKSDMAAIINSDLNDPASYANTKGGSLNKTYKEMAAAFNFQTDGTLAAGDLPQTAEQTKTTSQYYMVRYNDADEAADETLISSYKKLMGVVTDVDDFLADKKIMQLALSAFGLENEGDTKRKLKAVLTSDLNDPKSYANTLKDSRYTDLAKAYNFKTDGTIGAPILAQSQSEILTTAKAYVIAKSRFGTEEDKTKATAESKYYSAQMEKIDGIDAFLKDKRLTDFAMIAAGIDPTTVTPDDLRKIFTSDLDDPESYVNTDADPRFRELVASYNFNKEGKVERPVEKQIQSRRGLLETQELYYNQTMEEQEGEDNAGVRLALYFRRMASGVGSAYDLLADTALMQVIRTTYSIPEEMSSAAVDLQADYINRVLDLKDLQDPQKLEKLLQRFTALYDVNNNTDVSPAALILSSTSTSATISADSLYAISQLRMGG